MQQGSLNNMSLGLPESPLSSWPDFESFQNVKYEDEDMSEESILQNSDIETCFKEMETIQEVTVSETYYNIGEDTDALKNSILEDLFPDDLLKESMSQETWEESSKGTFEDNQELIAKVEEYLNANTGKQIKIDDDILASAWQLSDIPSPGSMITNQEPETGSSSSLKVETNNIPPHKENTSMKTEVTSPAADQMDFSNVDADTILSQLMSGNVVEEMNESTTTESTSPLPNTFTTVGANGEKMICIVIAAPSSQTTSTSATATASTNVHLLSPPTTDIDYQSSSEAALSPADSSLLSPRSTTTSFAATSEDDEDWRPCSSASSSLEATAGPSRPRKKYERKNPSRGPRPGPYPQNKMERKKAQNRTAAWRYREKKKQEQEEADNELEQLMNRNAELKKHLADVELQMKCVKQLMAEAGFGHLLRAI